ncbi:group II intron maturase-specific domain-containing protein [Butyrivibrio sp. YAB3001]|uniref:group II intron maturase-specific domain-containing protein n=1 Tax=Butyrivibrio sp. YAB3001 TaxID=1520812 RepID=UPI0021017633|nr:group II intron maturase-specific domain-containing protein [Butyrivibrio sp. YAB3001]
MKRKTSKKKFTKKCKEVNRWLADMRTLPLQEIIKRVNSMLVGYFHYYGITDNSKAISDFKYIVRKLLFKWLNRRSQRRSYNWGQFNDMLRDYPLATPRTYVSIYE